MTTNDLKLRIKKFTLDVMELVEKLPTSVAGRTISNQIIRSGTSVGADYRAVCRARSDREFVSKMNIVLEEADESVFWLEIIFVSSLKTVNNRLNNPNQK